MPTFVVVNPRLRKISPLTCETIQEAQDIEIGRAHSELQSP